VIFADIIGTKAGAAAEVRQRQELVHVALGKVPADLVLRIGRVLNVHAAQWMEDWEIVVKGDRVAWTGPAGLWKGEAARRVHHPDLFAAPGFGEVHKHIESTHITPEYEAELVLPFGNTWTCEGSHEIANVVGDRTAEFWSLPRQHGVPFKIFPLIGAAVPPTAYECCGGGYFDYGSMDRFLRDHLGVIGLDEVMDWTSVWNPENPFYARTWGMLQACFEHRGVIEGHAARMEDPHAINAFAASGISSDHEVWKAQEAWDKLLRGLFVEIRPYAMQHIADGLIERGLTDWSNTALTTDDRGVADTLKMGATDYNLRLAIECGIPLESAYQMVTINPARHMRIDHWVGSIAPGRFADVVLLEDPRAVKIVQVYADGKLVADRGRYLLETPKLDWPSWARSTINIGRRLSAEDFRVPAEPGRATMQAALLRPRYYEERFPTVELPVVDGAVQRDPQRLITKMAMVDRYTGEGKVAKMFWQTVGPNTPDTALACSVAHDKHNIWVMGSSDEAMALAVNTLAEQDGGWALVKRGRVAATVRLEIGGLMAARPPEMLAAEFAKLFAEGEEIDWHFELNANDPRIKPGFPYRTIFYFLTCLPWKWVLVAPAPNAPTGLVNVETGETHPVVW
jgi:adenine deaminase